MNEHELLDRIRREYEAILDGKLVGIYVHGSLAFGCFTWDRSDIDFLVVVDAPLSPEEKRALIEVLLRLDAAAPPKGFEMSVVLQSACSPFQWPTPYELHYSNAHKDNYVNSIEYYHVLQGNDPDLAAHFTVTRAVGYALCGKPIEEVFAPVPRAHYLRSLLLDIETAAEDIADNPVYCALNLCRLLAYLRDKSVYSKQQGGQWGLSHLPPRWHPLLRDALAVYAGGDGSLSGHPLRDFARAMLADIDEALPRCRWCNRKNLDYVNYHDHEWGVPEHDERMLFELLILEGFQAGLSWECVLNKREAFRATFDNFDWHIVGTYDETKVESLMQNAAIIRNRRKITAAIGNARAFEAIRAEYGSFDAYIWGFTGGKTILENDKISSPLSDQISNDLKKRGMRFVGTTIIYSYLQAIGVIDSHEDGCWVQA